MNPLSTIVKRQVSMSEAQRFLLYDPAGWLGDADFHTDIKGFGGSVLHVAAPTEGELDQIQRVAREYLTSRSRFLVLPVDSRLRLQAWELALGAQWATLDLSPAAVFPTLDKSITAALTTTQAAKLYETYGHEVRHGVRSPIESAEIVLGEVFGIQSKAVDGAEDIMEAALRAHRRFNGLPWQLVQALPQALLLDKTEDARKLWHDSRVFGETVRSLLEAGKLSADDWEARLAGISPRASAKPVIPADSPWAEVLARTNPAGLQDDIRAIDWTALRLESWADHAPLLVRLSLASAAQRDGSLAALEEPIHTAFAAALARDYVGLQQASFHHRPAMVHQIPHYLHGRHSGERVADRVALFIVDCLSLPLWSILRDEIQRAYELQPHHESVAYAWIPTLTNVSRQALLAGRVPAQLGASIRTTAKEGVYWREFWEQHGVPAHATYYERTAEARAADFPSIAKDPDYRRVALVFNDVDRLIHASTDITTFGFESVLRTMLRDWLTKAFGPALRSFSEAWTIYIATDHGSHFMRNALPFKAERLGLERPGQRARIYSLEDSQEGSVNDDVIWKSQGTLPPGFYARLAPPGFGYGLSGGWGHGGATWEEVLVPFARYGRLPR